MKHNDYLIEYNNKTYPNAKLAADAANILRVTLSAAIVKNAVPGKTVIIQTKDCEFKVTTF